jgi:hypothetical protein
MSFLFKLNVEQLNNTQTKQIISYFLMLVIKSQGTEPTRDTDVEPLHHRAVVGVVAIGSLPTYAGLNIKLAEQNFIRAFQAFRFQRWGLMCECPSVRDQLELASSWHSRVSKVR